MPHDPDQTSPRPVRFEDPSLSTQANRLLTDELQEVIGSDTAQVPSSRADHAADVHATHSPLVAGLIGQRLGLVITALTVLLVVAVVAVSFGGVLVLIAAVAALLLATAVVLFTTTRLAGEAEHVDPATAAALEEEGVGDPDRVLTDLATDFTTPEPTLHEEKSA